MKCRVCKENEATVRDRKNPTGPEKEICRECQRKRLDDDMKNIISFWKERATC